MHLPHEQRYSETHGNTPYRRMGRSGLALPAISLGLWQNFGAQAPVATQRDIIVAAFDRGITQFDLANNYGPPPGSAEENFGRILHKDLRGYRDELVITTKAGYRFLPGPYGEGGSRKYLLSSLDSSLKRMNIDYVDIFYSHRYDPTTPLHETLGALKFAVDSGKALYAGISSYSAARTREALQVASEIGLTLSVHQPSYSLLNRWIEEEDADGDSVASVCAEAGLGIVAFSPLAQGLLTTKYLSGDIPTDSRAAQGGSFSRSYVSQENITALRALNDIAVERGQSLAQMALAWTLRRPEITSVIVGARTVEQLSENLDAVLDLEFTDAQLRQIEATAVDGGLNLWASRSSDL